MENQFWQNIPVLNHPTLNFEIWNNSLRNYFFALLFGILISLFLLMIKRISHNAINHSSNKHSNSILLKGSSHALKTIRNEVLFLIAFYVAIISLKTDPIVQKTLYIILIIAITWQTIAFLELLSNYFLKKKLGGEKGEINNLAGVLIQKIIKIGLWTVSAIFILSNLEINVTSLLTGLGIGGIAIALALQNILQDLFSSLAIYLDRPFDIGDTILIGDTRGSVEMIGIKSTRLRAPDGEEIIITNRELTSARIKNFGRMKNRSTTFHISIDKQTPTNKLSEISEIILTVINKMPEISSSSAHLIEQNSACFKFEIGYHEEKNDTKLHSNLHEKILLNIFSELEKKNIKPGFNG